MESVFPVASVEFPPERVWLGAHCWKHVGFSPRKVVTVSGKYVRNRRRICLHAQNLRWQWRVNLSDLGLFVQVRLLSRPSQK